MKNIIVIDEISNPDKNSINTLSELFNKNHNTQPQTGISIIAAERLRQITEEGFSIDDDVTMHLREELPLAAVCYAMPVTKRQLIIAHWPFRSIWWKPTPNERVMELAKAGALIAAEIDRIRRIEGLI